MHDFRGLIRARITSANLSAGDERSVIEELNAHLQDLYTDLRSRGVSHDEAMRSVEAEITTHVPLSGALQGLKASASTVDTTGAPSAGGFFTQILTDLRYAARAFTKAPGFALSAVLALGIGTGAATAVFSLLNGVVLRPLPYAHPDRLVTLWEVDAGKGLRHQPVSPVSFMDYRSTPATFTDAAAWWKPETSLTDDRGDPIRVPTVETSENLFSVVGVRPAIGRAFDQDSALFGTTPQAVISDALWHSRYGADPHVIGRSMRLNGYATTIIGVMPPGFHYPDDTDVWTRLSWDMRKHNRGAHFMEAVARLRDGVSAEQANRAVANLGSRIASENPSTNKGWSAEVVPLRADVAGVFRPGLIALFGAATLLLMIACMNVANLLLARAAARATEIAVRSALGASRMRLVRQLLTECLLLAVAGSAIGLLTATTVVRAFLAWSPVDIPRSADVSIDRSVFIFAAGVAAVTTLLFGLYPALRASRSDLQSVLRQANRSGSSNIASRGRGVLVVFEIGLSVALLCGAGLLVHTVSTLLHQDTGVTRSDAVVTDIQLPDASYGDFLSAAQFYDKLTTALRASPMVTDAGVTNFLPLDAGWRIPFERAADPPAQPGAETNVQYHTVDGGYFDALGVHVLSGRGIAQTDRVDTKPVVVINHAMAQRYWPNENPVGKSIRAMGRQIGPLGRRLINDDEHEIVGVVSDIRNVSLTDPAEPAVYSAIGQFPFLRMYVVVRGKGTPAQIADLVRTEVRRIDPALPIGKVQTMEHALGKATDPPRFLMVIMGVFSILALALAAFGIHGLLAYMVNERKREFGIRMALGATRGRVLGLVMRQGLTLGMAGALLGILLAYTGSRALQSVLYGVQAHDPLTLIAAGSIVVCVAAAATLAPALRATRVEAGRTLRE